jgi:hypothetical protein
MTPCRAMEGVGQQEAGHEAATRSPNGSKPVAKDSNGRIHPLSVRGTDVDVSKDAPDDERKNMGTLSNGAYTQTHSSKVGSPVVVKCQYRDR